MENNQNEKSFFDISKKPLYNYLKNIDDIRIIENNIACKLSQVDYMKCMNHVICNSIYEQYNDEQFCYLIDKYVEFYNKYSLPIPYDSKMSHPILHELSHQLPRTFNKLKHCMKYDYFKNLMENDKYLDTYGMNFKQRLSISINSPYILEEIINWIRDHIQVKPFPFKHDNYGRIIHPKSIEYSV